MELTGPKIHVPEVGPIPSDWKVESLSSIGKFRKGQGIRKAEAMSGEIPCVRYGELYTRHNDYIKRYYSFISQEISDKSIRLKPGDILFAGSGETKEEIGKCAAFIDDIEAYAGGDIIILSPFSISGIFLGYLLNAPMIQKQKASMAQGDAIVHISANQLGNLRVPLPQTSAEQTAIANALSDTDALIENIEKLITKKRNIKQGVMQKLLRPKEDWIEKILSETATLKARIGWQGLTTAEYKLSGDFFLITGTEFKNGFIDWDKCFFVQEERYKQDKNIQVKLDDILVTKDGTIGKIALIKSFPKPATLNSGVFVIRPIDNAFNPRFFYYLLLSEVFKKFLSQLSAGSTINHLYQKDFVTFRYSTPKTYEEQKRIAQIIYDIDTEINSLEERLEKYQMIKKGMMHELLTGKIRLS
jgi:type I restriction enzyme, S subunit